MDLNLKRKVLKQVASSRIVLVGTIVSGYGHYTAQS